MDDNLSLSEKIKERYRGQYTGVFYKRYILGLWVIAEGIIYDMFDSDRHVVKREDVKDKFTEIHYISCDYGTQNATVFLLWTKGIDGIWYCEKEYYYSGRSEQKQKTDAEYTKDLKEFIGDTRIRAVVIDPSASSFIASVREANIPVLKAKNAVLDGIRECSVLLNTERVKFCDTCIHTIEEFGQYAWDEKSADRGEDVPIKASDHCMDAFRYHVHTVIVKSKAIIKDKKGKGLR